MVEPLASVSRVAMIGLQSTSVSLIDMSVLARWKVRPRLMGIPGVANVSIYGLRDRQLQVQVDPSKLRGKDVTLTQVIETAGNALWVSPLTFVEASTPGTGGFIEGKNQRLAVQHVLPITTADSLGQVSIEGTKTPMRLGDVTQVIEDHQPLIGDAVDATPTLFLVIQKFPDADTMTVTKNVEEAMKSLAPGLKGIQADTSVYRPASFLESARGTVGLASALGFAALLLVALLLFWSWRAALVIGACVSVSTVGTLYLLYLTNTTLTTMTLGGLVAALVLIIAVVAGDVEAVRLTLQSQRADGEERVSAAELISETIAHTQRTAAVALLISALALTPLLVLDPISTALAKPLVLTFALAVAIALAIGLTVTPALFVLVTRPGQPATRERRGLRWLTGGLSHVVSRFALTRSLVWGAVGVLLIGALAVIPQARQHSLIPSARELNVLLHFETTQGTSLPEMDRVAALMSSQLRTVPGVESVGGHVGRAVTSDQLGDVNAGELWLRISDSADYNTTARRHRPGRSRVRRCAHRAQHLRGRPRRRREVGQQQRPRGPRPRPGPHGPGAGRRCGGQVDVHGRWSARAARPGHAADAHRAGRGEPACRRAVRAQARRHPPRGDDPGLRAHGRQPLRAGKGVRRRRPRHAHDEGEHLGTSGPEGGHAVWGPGQAG